MVGLGVKILAPISARIAVQLFNNELIYGFVEYFPCKSYLFRIKLIGAK